MLDALFLLAGNMMLTDLPPPPQAAEEMLVLDAAPLTADELSAAQGGFSIGGYEIEFGLHVDLGNGEVFSYLSNPEVLARALGEHSSPYQPVVISEATSPLDGFTRVINNSLDDVILSFTTELNLVVDHSEVGPMTRSVFRLDQALAPATAFGSF